MADLLDFDYQAKYSRRRKTMCVQITDGQVQVMVPARTPEWQVRNLVRKHADWIRNKLAEQAARPKAAPKRFEDGEHYSYLGASHRLRVIDGAPWPAELTDDGLVVVVPARLQGDSRREAVKSRLLQWYRQTALEEFRRRSTDCARRLGVAANGVRVKTYKRRWGSCSAKGELSFNWCLIMAPEAVLDYVVAHEVAHLVHHNHSPDFWRVVARLHPDYRQQQAWLNRNGGLLAF